MPTREIPSIPYDVAIAGGALDLGRRIGTSLPMLAITDVPIAPFDLARADNPHMNRQVNEHGEKGSVATLLNNEMRVAFHRLVQPLMSSVLGDETVSLDYDWDAHKFSPIENAGQLSLFAVHTHGYGKPAVLGNDLPVHLDQKFPGKVGDIFAAHLSIEGMSRVLARRSTIIKSVYHDKIETEPLFERTSDVGDLHIFVRQGVADKNLTGLRRSRSGTVHGFSTRSERRTHIETSFGRKEDWLMR